MSETHTSLPPLWGVRTEKAVSSRQCDTPADTVRAAATWHAGGSGATVALPPLNTTSSTTAPRLSHRLRERQWLLECADAAAAVVREEKNLRSMLMASEYEGRHALRWRSQMEAAKRRRYDAATEAQRAAAAQQRYMLQVRLHEELGAVPAEEAAARAVVARAEAQSRAHIASLRDVAELQREAARVADEQLRAEALFEDFDEVRRMQMAQVAKYYRAPKLSEAPIERLVASVIRGEGAAAGEESRAAPRPARLHSLAFLDEEFAARQQLRIAEQMERLVLAHAHGAVAGVGAAEAAARLVLHDTCALGACPSRLRAVLSIQRWWRLGRLRPWAVRHHIALVEDVRARRAARTAAEWRACAARIARTPAPPLTGAEGADCGDAAAALQQLEAAATLPSRYAAALDYYVYTLAVQAQGWREAGLCDARWAGRGEDERRLAARPPLPHRFFPLHTEKRVAHYIVWRKGRWWDGALAHLRALASLPVAEAAGRAELCAREARARASLDALASALATGTVAAHCRALAVLVEEEAGDRALVAAAAEDERGAVRADWCATMARTAVRDRPFRVLASEESAGRGAVMAAEAAAVEALTELHWRWARVADYRQRLAANYTTTRGWRLAVHRGGVGAHFVSVDSAARVVQRFLARVRDRHTRAAATEVRLAKLAVQEQERLREERLRLLAHARAAQLSGLLAERREAALQARRAAQELERKQPGPTLEDPVVVMAEAAAQGFGEWFGWAEAEPRDLHYREVLARFHSLHSEFFPALSGLLLFLREHRQRIEEEEADERRRLRSRLAYRVTVAHTLACSEAGARAALEAEERSCRHAHVWDLAVAQDVDAWVARVESLPVPNKLALLPPPLASAHRLCTSSGTGRTRSSGGHGAGLRGAQPSLAPLTPLERLMAREDVVRAGIALSHRRGLAAFLFDFAAPMRGSIVTQEAEHRLVVCSHVDCLFLPAHPPVAQLAALTAQEAAAREAIVAEATAISYAAPLLRAHCMLLRDTLWPRFLIGHLTLSSNGAYMDRRLLTLLTQRVGHMGAKLSDLVQQEEAARGRVEYLEELTRELRFVEKKLIL